MNKFSLENLTIHGFQNESVPNTFFRQNMISNHLVIILPGAGYSARMPLLYYTINMFLHHGADILTVDYDYSTPSSLKHPDFKQQIIESVTSAIRTALSQRSYDHVVLVGKSLGTRVMSWILSDHAHLFKDIPDFKTVWLTPLWIDKDLFPLMCQWSDTALHIIGTGDRYYTREHEEEIRKSHNVVTIPNADHSLDIDGDLGASLEAIRTAVDAIQGFSW